MKYALIAMFALPAAFSLPAAGADGDAARYLEETRGVAVAVSQRLRRELKQTIENHGPETTIKACSGVNPQVLEEASISKGWRIGRVSLRVRNPALGMPDAWEQQALLDFERRAGAGENPDKIELGEIVSEPAGRYYRYMKALPVQEICLHCHGEPVNFSPIVRMKLETAYPYDRATGYKPGEIRGAISVKRPL